MTEVNHRDGKRSRRRYGFPRRWLINRVTRLGDRSITACGDPGVGKEVAGAKQFVRSRTRFHENAVTKQMVKFLDSSED